MKQRIEGRVEGGDYVIRTFDETIMFQVTLAAARADTRLAAAIARNGWEEIPEE